MSTRGLIFATLLGLTPIAAPIQSAQAVQMQP